jgi:putative hydrolase of the HAD superfamily
VTIRAVVFDLDGVVRHFEPEASIEARFGLPPGALYKTAFLPELLDATVIGERHYDAWIAGIGDVLARTHGEHARGAATAFSELGATVDREIIDLMRRLRAARYVVAILTNGTTRVEAEVEALGIDREIDHFFNSARIGYAKPDPRAFEHVLTTLDVAADECVFTDDSPPKCEGARTVGMHVVDYTNAAELERALRLFEVIA